MLPVKCLLDGGSQAAGMQRVFVQHFSPRYCLQHGPMAASDEKHRQRGAEQTEATQHDEVEITVALAGVNVC